MLYIYIYVSHEEVYRGDSNYAFRNNFSKLIASVNSVPSQGVAFIIIVVVVIIYACTYVNGCDLASRGLRASTKGPLGDHPQQEQDVGSSSNDHDHGITIMSSLSSLLPPLVR